MPWKPPTAELSHDVSPHADALPVGPREERGVDKAFCRDTTVIRHRAHVLPSSVLSWNPVGKKITAVFIFPEICGLICSRTRSLSPWRVSAYRGQRGSAHVSLCTGWQGGAGSCHLWHGSSKHAEHAQQKEKTASLAVRTPLKKEAAIVISPTANPKRCPPCSKRRGCW